MIASTLAAALRLITGAQPKWLGCTPSPRPRVYFANHCSNLDGPAIWAALPESLRRLTRPVAARDYWLASPTRRYFACEIFNSVLIERRKPTPRDNPIEDMVNAIGDDGSLILFPEGGRFPGPDPAEFKPGLFHLARRRPDVEFVPVLLDNMNRILPKGELIPVPIICNIIFGSPMRLEREERRDTFLQRARQAIIDLRNCQRS